MLLLLVIVTGAIVFDACRGQLPVELVEHQEDADNHRFDISQVYFYNPVSGFKISAGDRLFSKFLFAFGHDRFVSAYHNQKISNLLKVEALKVRTPFNLMTHSRKLMISHLSGLDDDLPLS